MWQLRARSDIDNDTEAYHTESNTSKRMEI